MFRTELKIRESSFEITDTGRNRHKKEPNSQVCSPSEGLGWTHLAVQSSAWWLVLQYWDVGDGARKGCCSPQFCASCVLTHQKSLLSHMFPSELCTEFTQGLVSVNFFSLVSRPWPEEDDGCSSPFSCTSVSCLVSLNGLWLSTSSKRF